MAFLKFKKVKIANVKRVYTKSNLIKRKASYSSLSYALLLKKSFYRRPCNHPLLQET